jgi:hypothetical protein
VLHLRHARLAHCRVKCGRQLRDRAGLRESRPDSQPLGNNSACWESWTYGSIGNQQGQDRLAVGAAAADIVITDTYGITQLNMLSSTSYAYGMAGIARGYESIRAGFSASGVGNVTGALEDCALG